MDSDNNLTEIIETKNIIKTGDGAIADNQVLDIDSLVSMNMWGLTLDFLDVLGEGFKEFFDKEVCQDPLKSEYLIPVFIGQLLEQGKLNVKVLRTDDTWYGMTYKEDVITVKERFSEGGFRYIYPNGNYSNNPSSNEIKEISMPLGILEGFFGQRYIKEKCLMEYVCLKDIGLKIHLICIFYFGEVKNLLSFLN